VNRAGIRHVFAEAWSISRSGPGRTALAIGLIALSLYLPGLLLLASRNVSRLASRAESPVVVVATLSPEADAHALANRLAALPRVTRVRIVWPAAARDRFLKVFPELAGALVSLGEVPFPTSLEISMAPFADAGAITAVAAQARSLSGIEVVEQEADFERRFRDAVSLLKNSALFLGIVLVLAAVLSIASAVRLALDQHRDEVEIMRLMGATEAAVRAPFWLQGAEQGVAGGVLAWLALAVTFRLAVGLLARGSHPILSILWVEFFRPWSWLFFPVTGAVAGFLGAAMAVGRKGFD
jgi:cell division transport system permease protein